MEIKSNHEIKKKKDKIEEVVIQVGLLEWNDWERKLKPKRGKQMALRVYERCICHNS